MRALTHRRESVGTLTLSGCPVRTPSQHLLKMLEGMNQSRYECARDVRLTWLCPRRWLDHTSQSAGNTSVASASMTPFRSSSILATLSFVVPYFTSPRIHRVRMHSQSLLGTFASLFASLSPALPRIHLADSPSPQQCTAPSSTSPGWTRSQAPSLQKRDQQGGRAWQHCTGGSNVQWCQ